MIGETTEDRFLIHTQVSYAKAIFSNLDLIAHLEGGISDDMADAHLKKICFNTEGFKEITRSHINGRFLRLRELHPSLTDEALEHRIAWAVGSACREHAALIRADLDSPAHCTVPLLTRLAKIFLCEARDGSMRVRSNLLAEWQDLILVVPPMLISAAWMVDQLDGPYETISSRITLQKQVQRWLCDSTLPTDDNPILDQLCNSEGLDEVHMHLNGTTEAEKVWMDALRKTSRVVDAVSGVIRSEDGIHAAIGSGVNRLLRQEDSTLTPKLLRKRVEHAVALKSFLLEACHPSSVKSMSDEFSLASRYAVAIRGRTNEYNGSVTSSEALQLIDIIANLVNGNNCKVHGIAFLWYALIRAQFCRLLVQQVSCTGFDQFQYITSNELRETTEKDFAERFRQIERGLQKPIDFLEGRFAPKTTPDGNAHRLMQILRGYLQFLDEGSDGNSYGALTNIFSHALTTRSSLREMLELVHLFEAGITVNSKEIVPRSQRRLRLGLVVHFIKRTDASERDRFRQGGVLAPVCRDSKARREADQAARALVVLMNKTTGLSEMIRGVDAASNERHAGPEVFAQVFRRMRRAGIQRFTYHAGEDFVHITSGLRAMYEAVYFLELSAGCRIGHGTAAGLVPKKWWASVEGCVIQTCEERLDDIVFAWGTLINKRVMLDKLPLLESEIRRLAMQIWKDPTLTPDLLFRSWKIRHLDPIVRAYGNYDVDRDRNLEIQMFQDMKRRDPDAHAHYLRRHGVGVSGETLRRGSESVLVTLDTDVLSVDIIEFLQEATLELLKERHIAIESLPSSNVRISIHETYEDHHAPSWLGFGRNFCSTSVVIGSDDPGIFATSLRMEYAHLLRALEVNDAGFRAIETLELINRTSKRFRF